MLIGGEGNGFITSDLKDNTLYRGYNNSDNVIKYFWEVVEEFNSEYKSRLLMFVTSCSRPPLLVYLLILIISLGI